ncbi:hypothetical protein FACS189411_08280 [Bacteroidia bacterium]|nr:hypothetical protein FACS189411_08280 [Bacteroidia bacterium]
MTVRSKWLPLILLLIAIVEICGCEKKVPAPKDEPQIVEPVEPPGFEIPPYDPEVAVPPIIIPSISGPTDKISIDSIKALFVGKWEMIGYVGEEGGLVASSGEISEYLSDGTIPTFYTKRS